MTYLEEETSHVFGGIWTQTKLNILEEYLNFFTTALQRLPYRLIYIDTFAGTGRCTIKLKGTSQTIPGSAQIALDASPGFDAYYFIEKKKQHTRELQTLLSAHINGPKGQIVSGDAVQELKAVLANNNWGSTRGVLFLDPYGLQSDWEIVEQIEATKALDVFFLVNLAGICRQAARNLRNADSGKRERLNLYFGTNTWIEDLYAAQGDMFTDQDDRTRHADPKAVTAYMKKRLQSVFTTVLDPVTLYQEDDAGNRGAPLFALFFAISNPNKKAIGLASKVAKDIMAKLR